MNKMNVNLLKDVNGVEFGCKRKDVRKKFGRKYKEMKKNQFSLNTMDAYEDFHIFYDEDDCLEAIEFFGNAQVEVQGTIVFPANVETVKSIIPGVEKDSYGYMSKSHSVGFTVNDDGTIESILIGREGYYQD